MPDGVDRIGTGFSRGRDLLVAGSDAAHPQMVDKGGRESNWVFFGGISLELLLES
jgi:hypothetical protein